MRTYRARRAAFALGTSLCALILAFGLAFPWKEVRSNGFWHVSWESSHLQIAPLWLPHERPVYWGWVQIYLAAAVLLCACTWFVYPQYRPPPPPSSVS